MQYLKELPCGKRVVVTDDQHLVDSIDMSYHKIIHSNSLLVYKLAKPTPYRERHLKYGGRNRGGSHLPWNGA